MKDDTSHGKKSPQDEQNFPKDEEEVDFEILDALEQLENAGLPSGEDRSGDDSMIELTVDDDMMFGEDDSEESGGFKFDANVSANLEEELLSDETDENLDVSFGGDVLEGIQTTDEEPFAIDLNEEDLSIDEDVDLDLDDSGFDMSAAETLAFTFNHDEETSDADIEAPEEEGSAIGEYDFDLDHDLAASPDEETLEQGADDSLKEASLGEDGEISKEFDLSQFGSENEVVDEFDLGGQEIELEKGFSDLQDEIAHDLDEFQGKAVISIGDDDVIDLGDESDLERDQVYTMPEPAAIPEDGAQEGERESVEEEHREPVKEEEKSALWCCARSARGRRRRGTG